MSRFSEQITVTGSAEAARLAAKHAIATLGWKSVERDGALVAKVGMSATAWPSKLTLGFSEESGSTTINVDGHIYGWGPIQKKHLRKRMDEFRSALQPPVAG